MVIVKCFGARYERCCLPPNHETSKLCSLPPHRDGFKQTFALLSSLPTKHAY